MAKIIPAQPGFNLIYVFFDDEEMTVPADISPYVSKAPIIAWRFRDDNSLPEPVTPFAGYKDHGGLQAIQYPDGQVLHHWREVPGKTTTCKDCAQFLTQVRRHWQLHIEEVNRRRAIAGDPFAFFLDEKAKPAKPVLTLVESEK